MNEPPYEREPGWLEWAISIALVVVVVIVALNLIGNQSANIFNNGDNFL